MLIMQSAVQTKVKVHHQLLVLIWVISVTLWNQLDKSRQLKLKRYHQSLLVHSVGNASCFHSLIGDRRTRTLRLLGKTRDTHDCTDKIESSYQLDILIDKRGRVLSMRLIHTGLALASRQNKQGVRGMLCSIQNMRCFLVLMRMQLVCLNEYVEWQATEICQTTDW